MPPQLSRITRLTLRWIEAPDYETDIAASNELTSYLEDSGNTQEQIDYWFSYSSNMMALEGETLASIIETEAILARMQGTLLAG